MRRALRRILVLTTVAAGAYVAWEAWTWPHVAELARRNPPSTAFIERWRDEHRRRPDWRWVGYAQISDHLKRAVLVAEDINFFSHHGFELSEVKTALNEAVERHRLRRGASTISQQVAKNLWLSASRNPLRKLKEAILTWQLERALDKRRILEIYLNVAEFGDGIFGAEAAARRYFDESAAHLDEDEAAQLAAALPKPRSWHPGSTSAYARRRTAQILERMRRAQFLWKQL
ncbi:MAG TPA: monofunctional biosynthetic peptidoglycan transglycosylase [Candidatus Polarisedimenticolaceae bacterium]|nr:monofunctional biosynthetic peptidoglycan transglycosylase [Candidatus Polarisedimenticolaceae bacterium]